jgi:hypothetical protein
VSHISGGGIATGGIGTSFYSSPCEFILHVSIACSIKTLQKPFVLIIVVQRSKSGKKGAWEEKEKDHAPLTLLVGTGVSICGCLFCAIPPVLS